MVVDKDQKAAVAIDVMVPTDSNIKKEEDEKLKKYQNLKNKRGCGKSRPRSSQWW